MKTNRVLPAPPAVNPHVAKLLSWPGPVIDEPADPEEFDRLRPRTTPSSSSPAMSEAEPPAHRWSERSSSPRAYEGGWVRQNLSAPTLGRDGHDRGATR